MDQGTTAIRVELVGDTARATLLHGGTYLRPRLLDTVANRVRVALIGSYATLLAGDDVAIDIEVGPGVHLDVVEPTAMVAYAADDVPAHWAASLRVAAGATLTWNAASFVVSTGANVTRRTDVHLADGGVALLGETLVLGRTDEGGGRLHSTQHAALEDAELLVEELDLRGFEQRATPGVLGESRVIATATLLGTHMRESFAEHETPLAGPGALARATTREAHEATARLAETWRRWYPCVTAAANAAPGSSIVVGNGVS